MSRGAAVPFSVEHDGVVITGETFGDPLDPPVVLVMGATASMLWWSESFCDAIAESGHFVVRYDHRDTGRSTTGAAGAVSYTAEDMAGDLIGVIEGLGLASAHLVGMSLGGYLSQIVAVRSPDRVRTLTLYASEPLGAEEGSLPGIDERFMDQFSRLADLDWSDDAAVTEYLVESGRLCAGRPERFDEAGTRDLIRRELDRTTDLHAAFNHGGVSTVEDWTDATARIACPTLVIHGALDPILPLPNGEALADLIDGARLVVLPDTGHELHPDDLRTIADALVTFVDEHGAAPASTDR